ncbi:MAG TPA: NAD(P)-dependent oxidoreductase [Acidimicrobiales bacterium]|jgi:phosphoglycerate dehydrogenase-like enzyme|nr:NAD(P)-dependent oxidoreductase [Acidimicrobiales bacterium]
MASGSTNTARVALAPEGTRTWLADAIRAGGGEVVGAADADALVWAEPAKAAELGELLRGDARGVKWVQLPWAGIEPYVEVIAAASDLTWTCAKGVYAGPVAEHALALLLAGLRNVGPYTRESTWSGPAGTNLLHGKVVVVGGGGITDWLLRLLEPFDADVTVIRRNPNTARRTTRVTELPVAQLDEALEGAIGVVLALALTPETEGIIGRSELERMSPRGWIVNVARGKHIKTAELVEVLREGTIGGAALDVTDPEPLPDGHPLWTLPNCIITPHVGNTPEMALPLLADRITENVRRWRAGDELLGLVDAAAGY